MVRHTVFVLRYDTRKHANRSVAVPAVCRQDAGATVSLHSKGSD